MRNNAYTNVMVAWLCGIAGQLLPLLPASRAEALRTRLGIGDDELAVWQDMSRRMFVPFHGDGIISQFEGYEDLEELDWDAYRAKYGNIQRLDRILRAEGKDPNRYKVTKQADTVMLFFLFRQDELREIFGRLGYDYRADTLTRNVEYYDRRTSHGSTLSFVTHAGVLAALDPESSWDRFLVALHSDVDDIQGGTTKEGIHMGVMSGTLDLMQRNYAGTHIHDGVLHFDPQLPSRLDEPVVRDAVPGDPDPGDAHRRSPDAGRPPGGREPARQGRSPRRCPRAAPRRPDRVRAQPEPGDHRALRPRLKRRPHAEIPGIDFRRRRGAGRLAAREGVARVAARADGVQLARHPRPHDVVARRVHLPRLPAVRIRQAAHERRPRRPRLLPGTRR